MRKRNRISTKSIYLNQEAFVWCHRNGYKIYPISNDGVNFKIEVSLAHQKFVFSDEYNNRTIHEGISKAYEKVYYSKQKQV